MVERCLDIDQQRLGSALGARTASELHRGSPAPGPKELPKGRVLNVTTIRTLESAFGGDTDDWIGAKVTLFVDPGVQFKGKVVGGVRLRPHKAKKTPPVAPMTGQADFIEEVPA